MSRFLLVVALLGAACTRDRPEGLKVDPNAAAVAPDQPAAPKTAPQAPPASPHGNSGAPTAPAGPEISGKVVETMNSGGYTYARLDRGGSEIWVAGPETKLAVGTQLGKMSGSLMQNFPAKSLNRTFEQIYFIDAFALDGAGTGVAAANPHGTGAVPLDTNPHGANGATTADDVKVDKIAPVAGGKTIADIYANKTALAGKPVVVHGKIVKMSTGILDRNWLHLRDGTGESGKNDLIVTTTATPKLGDVVVARGKVTLDKDLGGGAQYKYELLVEDATIDGIAAGSAAPAKAGAPAPEGGW